MGGLAYGIICSRALLFPRHPNLFLNGHADFVNPLVYNNLPVKVIL